MSAWAEADALKRDRFKTTRDLTKARLDKTLDSTWHARLVAKCYRYTLTTGEVREWHQHQLAHAHDFRRVEIVAACSEFGGPLPMLAGGRANRLTQKLQRVNCFACKVVLDRLLDSGRLSYCDKTHRFEPAGAELKPLYDVCRVCRRNRETCGHFVGGGTL